MVLRPVAMEEEEKKKKKNNNKQKHHQASKLLQSSDFSFKPSSEVKGLRFGGQFITKSFTIRRARNLELLKLLSLPPPPPTNNNNNKPRNKLLVPFSSTIAFIPTNFTILAYHAWHTLTLGLGTKKSKVVLFVFESEDMKKKVDLIWPLEISLGEVNKKLIRGSLKGLEMARFKFRKGCVTFYVYAVRQVGGLGFSSVEDLRIILQSVVSLNDFLDHTAMHAMPKQRCIMSFSHPVAMAH